MKTKLEKIERYCPHCDKDTVQLCYFSGHERDSSGDHATCTVCGWEYNGYTGKYEEPWYDSRNYQ